jgi:hypothetical protein
MPIETSVEDEMLNTWIEDSGVYLKLEQPEDDDVTAEYCRASSEDSGRASSRGSTTR